MKVRPKVAVITRTKNRPLLLPRAMKSVMAQTYKSFVWVVVNDGGKPGPVEALAATAKLSNKPVVVHNRKSLGMEAASNAAIRACDSDYIVIHDDDDSWHPDFLKETVAFLDGNPGDGGVVTQSMLVKERIANDKVNETHRHRFNGWVKSIYLIDTAQRNQFPPIAFLFRRELYDKIGGFDESLPVLGDWVFNLEMLMLADIGFIPKDLAHYHMREDAIGRDAIYANTVSHGVSQHIKYDALIRNRALRADLAANKNGLGVLLSLGRQHFAKWESIRTLSKTVADLHWDLRNGF